MTSNADRTRQQEYGRADVDAARSGAFAGPQPVSADECQVGLLLSDFEGRVYYADGHCRRLTGELARGRPWMQAVAQEDRGRVEAAWEESLISRLPFCAEFRIESARRQHCVRACGVYSMDVFDEGMPGWTVHFMNCRLE